MGEREGKRMNKQYQWQAVSFNMTGERVRTNWYGTAKEAKEAFFQQFPRRRACNITAAKEDPKVPGLMLHSLMTDPYIRNVERGKELNC
jgi:type I site-specific restriction endonuclease